MKALLLDALRGLNKRRGPTMVAVGGLVLAGWLLGLRF